MHVVEARVRVGEGSNRSFVVPDDLGALAFHADLAPLANVFSYIGSNVTSREQLRCCFRAWMRLIVNGFEDCFSHWQLAGQSLSKYRTIVLRWNSVEAASPSRDLMWTVEVVGRQHPFLEHVPWLQYPVGLL